MGISLAVMQPYFFPYLGYYQLARAADEFVFFDDVNYFKKGFINRNAILLAGARHAFSIPVRDPSQNRKIADHEYVGEFGPFLSLVDHAYRRAPYFEPVRALASSVCSSPDRRVSTVNALAVRSVFAYLGLERAFSCSSELAVDEGLRGQDRILEICHRKGATTYRNATGGQALYDPATFQARGVALEFVRMRPHEYPQGGTPFVPNLSMLDVLAWNSPARVLELLSAHDLA